MSEEARVAMAERAGHRHPRLLPGAGKRDWARLDKGTMRSVALGFQDLGHAEGARIVVHRERATG